MKQKAYVPFALHASGFKSAEEVRSVIKRLQKKSSAPEESWEYAVDRMLIKHSVPLDPRLMPNKNTWRLLAYIAKLTGDAELEAAARARIDDLSKESE